MFREENCRGKIENYEQAERFYAAEIKNKQGEDYEPESIIASLDRHSIKNKGYSLSIIRDGQLCSSKSNKYWTEKRNSLAAVSAQTKLYPKRK